MSKQDLREEIINYLNSKGRVRACLFSKLSNFMTKKKNYSIGPRELLDEITLMINKDVIEIIIPKPFEIKWKERESEGLTCLKEKILLKRMFFLDKELQRTNQNKDGFFFDSRTINDKNIVIKKLNRLKKAINSNDLLRQKIIILNPKNSERLNIYEKHPETYHLDSFQLDHAFLNTKEISIPINRQKANLKIIKAYRDRFMCLYITLIESIHKEIVDLQEELKSKNNANTDIKRDKLTQLIRRFCFYCEMFTTSDWIEIKEANPYRWETFFHLLDIPIRTTMKKIGKVKFTGRTFETCIYFNYRIQVDSIFDDEIEDLKKLGYNVFKSENPSKKSIGKNLEIFVPAPSIEHYFFIGKYLIYYHLFKLLHDASDLIKRMFPSMVLTKKDLNLYELFYEPMKSLFDIKTDILEDKLYFQYYTTNADELEAIYNELVFTNATIIEKKLFAYHMLKYNQLNQKHRLVEIL